MRVIKIWSGRLLVGTFPVGGGWGGWWANVWSVTPFTPPVGEILQRRPPDYNNAASYAKIKDSIYVKNQLWSAVGANQTVTHINIRQEPVNNLNYPDPVKLTQENIKLMTRMKQLEREKILAPLLRFHHITKIWGQLTTNQSVIGLKQWVIQNEFLDKIHTISNIIRTHTTATFHCATHLI